MCTAFEGWMNHALGGAPYSPMGNRDPEAAPCNAYPCRGEDEWIAVAAGTAGEWESLCRELGRPELASDPRFSSAAARKANENELDRIVSGWCRDRDRWAAAEALQAAGVPAFPSVSSADLRTDPHLAARGAFHRFEHPEVGVRAHFRVPWRWSRRDNGPGRRAPCLGGAYRGGAAGGPRTDPRRGGGPHGTRGGGVGRTGEHLGPGGRRGPGRPRTPAEVRKGLTSVCRGQSGAVPPSSPSEPGSKTTKNCQAR